MTKANHEQVPGHIAIIPDGNRRWAKEKGKDVKEGYRVGIDHMDDVVTWCFKAGVNMVTLWGFSTDNFKRDREQVQGLFDLFRKNLLRGLGSEDERRPKMRVRFLGRIERFPREIVELFRQVEEKTARNGPFQLNILLSYGGREEIVDAVNAILREGSKEVDESTLSGHMYSRGMPDPDLIIRTSGEQRLSGLMPWQSCYSEFFFSPKLWPDFSRQDFEQALSEYARRKRRYGK